MPPLPPFDDARLEAISSVLGDTASGLTGSEIGRVLAQLGVDDTGPSTKRWRIFEALKARQARDRSGNIVGAFIQAALNPVRFVRRPAEHEALTAALNEVLAFSGLMVGPDGHLARAEAVDRLRHE